MPIVLALVASGAAVLAEVHDEQHTRFLTAAETILARIPPNASRLSYAVPNEPWMFHFVAEDGLVYLNVSDADSGRRMPFAMLSAMQKEFSARFDLAEAASVGKSSGPEPSSKKYSSFSVWLTSTLKAYNHPSADAAAEARAGLRDARNVMHANIDQVLSRGERLDSLVDRTDQAASQSLHFRRRAVSLRRQMWWKNTRVTGMAFFCGIVIFFFLFGGLFHSDPAPPADGTEPALSL